MQDKTQTMLTEQDAALLEQGASMLEGLENDERNRGNCSTAEGAACSAHAVRRLAASLLAHAHGTFPAMTEELASILGLMCFQCIHFAQALRAGGYSIEKRAEDEQAAVLHWMLGHYFRSGPAGWRAAASADMERLRESAAKKGGTA